MNKKFNLLLIVYLFLVSCEKSSPVLEYFPDMYFSPARNFQSEYKPFLNDSVSMLPPQGAVPVNYYPYEYRETLAPSMLSNEDKGLKNPLLDTSIYDYKKGEIKFQTYCSPCHGVQGEGNGRVVGPYPRFDYEMPSLISDKINNWTDGQIYHIITMGRGVMGSYATQIEPKERWQLILYLRKLQEYKKKQ